MRGRTFVVLAVAMGCLAVCAVSFAGPQTLSYQGSLAGPLGSPVDGNYRMRFGLYDAAEA